MMDWAWMPFPSACTREARRLLRRMPQGEEAMSVIFPGIPKETVLKYRVNPTYPEEEFKPSEVSSEDWESLPKFRRAALALAVVEYMRTLVPGRGVQEE